MAAPLLLTFADVVDHLVDYLGGSADSKTSRDVKYSVEAAYREMTEAHKWAYLYKHYRIVTSASQTSSTITYTHTGGAYERVLTLAAGTWPTWAVYGSVSIAGIIYQVEDRKSATQLTLDAIHNPGADVAAGTSYQIFRSAYTLPSDFRTMDGPLNVDGSALWYVHPTHWLACERAGATTGTSTLYTIMGDPNLIASQAIHITPAPASSVTLDFIYQRMPRQLRYTGYLAADYVGTVAGTSGNSVLTGTSTSFASSHIGSVIRIGTASTVPDGTLGAVPYAEQKVLIDVTSTTAGTVDTNWSSTFSMVKYRITDPIDISPQMIDAFLRGCEFQVCIKRGMRQLPQAEALYQKAFAYAASASNPSFKRRVVGGIGPLWGSDVDIMPQGADSVTD